MKPAAPAARSPFFPARFSRAGRARPGAGTDLESAEEGHFYQPGSRDTRGEAVEVVASR